jgi:hypothetical protein
MGNAAIGIGNLYRGRTSSATFPHPAVEGSRLVIHPVMSVINVQFLPVGQNGFRRQTGA